MFGRKKSDKKRAEQQRHMPGEELNVMEYPGKEEGPAATFQSTLEEWFRYWGESYPYNMHSCALIRTFV
jgi:hypothetical protein